MLVASGMGYRIVLSVILAAPLGLAGCDGQDSLENKAARMAREAMPKPASNSAIPNQPPIALARPPAAAPPPGAVPDEAMKGEAGARSVLAKWAEALERRDWATARAQWGHHGADSGMSVAGFAAAWTPYRTVKVEAGEGTAEGAAGSLYYEVPVTITGTREDGSSYRLEGPVTLRRVNDVDGASPEDLRWHISRSGLEPKGS